MAEKIKTGDPKRTPKSHSVNSAGLTLVITCGRKVERKEKLEKKRLLGWESIVRHPPTRGHGRVPLGTRNFRAWIRHDLHDGCFVKVLEILIEYSLNVSFRVV